MIHAATVVQFVGILITTISGGGADVIMGDLNISGHTRFISYELTKLDKELTTWPQTGTFPKGGVTYGYVTVGLEKVTFRGPTIGFNYSIDKLPHLKCCCDTIARLKAAYADPDSSSRQAAHFIIDRGTYTSTKDVEAYITVLTLDDNPLTIEGVAPDGTKKQIVLYANANVTVGQAPISDLGGNPRHVHNTPSEDFLAYYRMVESSAACTKMPSGGAPCDPPSGLCCQTTRNRSKRAAPVLHPDYVGDINCSSSQWP